MKTASGVYAIEIESVESEAENIQGFVDQGDVIILVKELSDLDEYDICEDDITIVNKDEVE